MRQPRRCPTPFVPSARTEGATTENALSPDPEEEVRRRQVEADAVAYLEFMIQQQLLQQNRSHGDAPG